MVLLRIGSGVARTSFQKEDISIDDPATPTTASFTSFQKEDSSIEDPATRTTGPALICKDLQDILQPEGRSYQALLVQRTWDATDNQQHMIDKFANCGELGFDLSVQEQVCPMGEPEKVAMDLSETTQRVTAFGVQRGLPNDLGIQIQRDFEEIGRVMLRLFPTSKQMILKLDVMSDNACNQWHRDNYMCRALVAYNSCGTLYVDESNVNSVELDRGGMIVNKLSLKDESQVFAVNVGDIFFMKGKRCPDIASGLVHKSPPVRRHADGRVINRLLLKVDVN
jgi:hypothetical protein